MADSQQMETGHYHSCIGAVRHRKFYKLSLALLCGFGWTTGPNFKILAFSAIIWNNGVPPGVIQDLTKAKAKDTLRQ